MITRQPLLDGSTSRRRAQVAATLTVALLPAACTATTASGPDNADPGFPLTYSRTGGIAGFDDHLVISPRGVATLTGARRGKAQCRLPDSALTRLAEQAAVVDWSAVSGPDKGVGHPDELVILIRSPQGGGQLEAGSPPALSRLADALQQVADAAAQTTGPNTGRLPECPTS